MISCNHGPHFVTRCMCPGRILYATDRVDDELVGGQHQFSAEPTARGGMRAFNQVLPPLMIIRQRLLRIERQRRIPRLRGRNQRRRAPGLQRHAKKSRAPQCAAGLVTAVGFLLIENLALNPAIVRKCCALPVQDQP